MSGLEMTIRADSTIREPGRVYGVAYNLTGLGYATGNEADQVDGRVFCWESPQIFEEKIKKVERGLNLKEGLLGLGETREEGERGWIEGEDKVYRADCSVVKKDSTSVNALIYLRAPNPEDLKTKRKKATSGGVDTSTLGSMFDMVKGMASSMNMSKVQAMTSDIPGTLSSLSQAAETLSESVGGLEGLKQIGAGLFASVTGATPPGGAAGKKEKETSSKSRDASKGEPVTVPQEGKIEAAAIPSAGPNTPGCVFLYGKMAGLEMKIRSDSTIREPATISGVFYNNTGFGIATGKSRDLVDGRIFCYESPDLFEEKIKKVESSLYLVDGVSDPSQLREGDERVYRSEGMAQRSKDASTIKALIYLAVPLSSSEDEAPVA
eukprot:gb/GEZN01009224.1/.p1 GENE.gb/GEZN01009224.1/~~gb/GEZN01009224.1/.p1  ORF type:complete len:415 (+),score=61.68 gb/GEZN01009224.1/:109-1245(+)